MMTMLIKNALQFETIKRVGTVEDRNRNTYVEYGG
jgi:hypothetical protein